MAVLHEPSYVIQRKFKSVILCILYYYYLQYNYVMDQLIEDWLNDSDAELYDDNEVNI